MLRLRLQSITRHPSFIFAVLSVLAIVSFLAVMRLVNRYGEQEKALARRMYAQGQADQLAQRPERALEGFRAALLYDRDNSQYQLSLARALRDSGRTDEAESYLLRLWEANPQDGAVNLALGRLAARQGSVENALHYYHNAIYGVWPSNEDVTRSNAEFELIGFLLKAGAHLQAQAELITLAATHPQDVDTQLRIAQLFMEVGDYQHALAGFQTVLNHDHGNAAAIAGLGEAVFTLGRYHAAESYLRTAADLNPADQHVNELLQTARMIVEADPFARGISDTERHSRIRAAFAQAGLRIQACVKDKEQGIDLSQGQQVPPTNNIGVLQERWLEMKPKMIHFSSDENGASSSIMDLVGEIEQETAKLCGAPSGMDQALLLISQERTAADMGADK